MTIIGLTSARSSPGITCLSVGLAAAARHRGQQSFLIEADPAGGVLGLRFSLVDRPSLTTFASDVRREVHPRLLTVNTQEVLGVPTLLAPVDPFDTQRHVQNSADSLIELLRTFEDTISFIDLGRVSNNSASLHLASKCDLVLIGSRSTVEDVQATLFLLRVLESRGCESVITVMRDLIHDRSEIEEMSSATLLGHIPEAPRASAAFMGGRFTNRSLMRTEYWRAIDALFLTLSEFRPHNQASAPQPEPAATASPPANVPPPPVFDQEATGPQQEAPSTW